jgi:hypothetical protein
MSADEEATVEAINESPRGVSTQPHGLPMPPALICVNPRSSAPICGFEGPAPGGAGSALPIRCRTCDMESGEASGARNGAAGLRWSVNGSYRELWQGEVLGGCPTSDSSRRGEGRRGCPPDSVSHLRHGIGRGLRSTEWGCGPAVVRLRQPRETPAGVRSWVGVTACARTGDNRPFGKPTRRLCRRGRVRPMPGGAGWWW